LIKEDKVLVHSGAFYFAPKQTQMSEVAGDVAGDGQIYSS